MFFTRFVSRNDLALQECCVPACPTVGAVIANAVFDATGARKLRQPITPATVLPQITRPSLSKEFVRF